MQTNQGVGLEEQSPIVNVISGLGLGAMLPQKKFENFIV